MPRPQQKLITFTVDGREVQAPENMMLVDAAKAGDVEIPVFCYEPKLGQPVGACRMCLVEIEGIPKLQTACSTPVKEGMVVNTENTRVKEAQESVVEFLLVNHPLDCPVCDKGGECPLQDIAFGWGRGRSRFIEAKRHFEKPIELSPTIAIDRERCILCYRCVRFSQEVAEDHQLVLLERGSDSYVSTFDGHPYIAPFSGNITELCPVGALTSQPYRFRARPWDIEGSGTVCTLCPAQCNVELTIRDDKVIRVLARDNTEVDDGWLCDKGRFAYQSIQAKQRITQPLVREGGQLRPTSWERALDVAGSALKRAGDQAAAIAGSGTTNEEGYLLQKLFREGLASPHLDSRISGCALSANHHAALEHPDLQAKVTDVEFAHTVVLLGADPLDEMPILDLRIRKGVRRQGVKLALLSERPTLLTDQAAFSATIPPQSPQAWVEALHAICQQVEQQESTETSNPYSELGKLLQGSGKDIVIVVSERLFANPHGHEIAAALLRLAKQLELAKNSDAGILFIPSAANGRGLREVGVLPDAHTGYQAAAAAGKASHEIAVALKEGELNTLYLDNVDPIRDSLDAQLWQKALANTTNVIARSLFLSDALSEYATVVFPAETYPEQEGTVTHPDGRIQRLRQAIKRPKDLLPGWQILSQLIASLDPSLTHLTCSSVSNAVFSSVPFYYGITLDTISGRGIRWQEQPSAQQFPTFSPTSPAAALNSKTEDLPAGSFRLGVFRSLWSTPEVEHTPALTYMRSKQRLEISPQDAEQLGITSGDHVRVIGGDITLTAPAAIRSIVPERTVFLQAGIQHDNANMLQQNPYVRLEKVQPALAITEVGL